MINLAAVLGMTSLYIAVGDAATRVVLGVLMCLACLTSLVMPS